MRLNLSEIAFPGEADQNLLRRRRLFKRATVIKCPEKICLIACRANSTATVCYFLSCSPSFFTRARRHSLLVVLYSSSSSSSSVQESLWTSWASVADGEAHAILNMLILAHFLLLHTFATRHISSCFRYRSSCTIPRGICTYMHQTSGETAIEAASRPTRTHQRVRPQTERHTK